MSAVPTLQPPVGAEWEARKCPAPIPSWVLWAFRKFYPWFFSDIWQAGYKQGARDARTADRMAAIEKMPLEVELVTRTNQHVRVLTRRDENAFIGTPWTPFD